MRIFLSIPVQGSRLSDGTYASILACLDSKGHSVLNREVNSPPPIDSLGNLDAGAVHDHNVALLLAAELVVAEVSNPSLGVGYELALAAHAGIPILGLCQANATAGMSVMIRGIRGKFALRTYSSLAAIDVELGSYLTEALVTANVSARDWSSLDEHFDALASEYDTSTEWRQDRHLLDWFASQLNEKKRCLDLGTGTGLVGARLKRPGTFVVGVDRAREMLVHASARVDIAVQADCARLPFVDSTFDGAAMRSVLHYVDEIASLREVRRVLSDGGVFACAQAIGISVESAAWWGKLKSWTHPLRRRFHTKEMLLSFFDQASFRVSQVDVLRIGRKESWDGILRNCPADHQNAVRTFIEQIPAKVAEESKFTLTADGICYSQAWMLIAATTHKRDR